MRIFLTGANGWVGAAIVDELITAGHSIVGLVRSAAKAAPLEERGVTPVIGSLTDLDVLGDAVSRVDAVIHTAFGLDFSRMAELADEDRQAIQLFGRVFSGSDRPLVVTGGFDLSQRGALFTESARPPVDPNFPRASEQTAFELADRGVNAMAVRLARSVHGLGETHGFVPMLARLARESGVSAYVGDGQNRWPAVHRLDAAKLYRLAVEKPEAGATLHAVAENTPVRKVAEAIGRQLNLPAKSISNAEADAHFGALAPWVAGDAPAANEATRELTGWMPTHPDMLAYIDRAAYYA